MSTMRSFRSVPKVNYAWMDVEADNLLADPDYVYEEPEEYDTETNTQEESNVNPPTHRYNTRNRRLNYSNMEFTEENAPDMYVRIRGFNREKMVVTWRTVKTTVLDNNDEDYNMSDDDEE